MHALAFKDKLNCYLQLIFESFGKTVYIRFVCVCRKINDNMLTIKESSSYFDLSKYNNLNGMYNRQDKNNYS